MAYFHFTVVVLGLIYIVTDSAIFSPVRFLLHQLFALCGEKAFIAGVYLTYCPACCGFWIGMICSAWWPVVGKLGGFEAALFGMLLGRIWAQFFPGTAMQQEMTSGEQESTDDKEKEEGSNG